MKQQHQQQESYDDQLYGFTFNESGKHARGLEEEVEFEEEEEKDPPNQSHEPVLAWEFYQREHGMTSDEARSSWNQVLLFGTLPVFALKLYFNACALAFSRRARPLPGALFLASFKES